jgi:FkbM family methyltransferase
MSDISMMDQLLHSYVRAPNHPMKLRLVYALLKLRGARPIRTRLGYGTFDLDLSDWVQSHMFFDGVFEPKTMALLQSLLKPGDCFLDIGANIGQFSVAAGSLLRGNGVVVAVEAHPEICAELMRNRSINKLEDTISVVSAAVADRRRFATFGVHYEGNRGSSREVASTSGGEFHTVTSTLRDICAGLNVKTIDLMKVDVEGAELAVFRSLFDGGTDLRPRHIVFEYLSQGFDYRDDRGAILGCLADEGYEVMSIDGHEYTLGMTLPEENLWARRKH